jgi:hypothetical protein
MNYTKFILGQYYKFKGEDMSRIQKKKNIGKLENGGRRHNIPTCTRSA